MSGNIGVGVLTFAVVANTTDMQILPAQDFRTDDGRPAEVENFKINAAIAEKVIAKLASRKNDLLIDYEHQSLLAATNGQPVPAAGWFNQMEWREGSGMWLKQVDLTNKAKDHIREKEYRYTSPVFLYDKRTGEITEVISVALTNTPAVDGMKEIVALTAKNLNKSETTEDTHMTPTEIAALSTQVTTLEGSVAALTAERDTANGKVTALTAELKTATDKLTAIESAAAADKAAAETKERDALITTALSDGLLTPKQKDWASKQSLAALTEFLGAAPVILEGKLQHEKKNEGGNENGLTEIELSMCSRMQVDPADFAKTKALEAKA